MKYGSWAPRKTPGCTGIWFWGIRKSVACDKNLSAGSLFGKVLPRGSGESQAGEAEAPERFLSWSPLGATGAPPHWGPRRNPQKAPQSVPPKVGGCGSPTDPCPGWKGAPGGTVAVGKGLEQKGREPKSTAEGTLTVHPTSEGAWCGRLTCNTLSR